VQGYVDSPFIFQYLMDTTLGSLRHTACLVYIDDIAIYGRSLDELLERMQRVFDRLRGAKLRLRASKCQFATDTAKFLGFIFHQGSILAQIQPRFR
jgi:Reverse transcriptase (RNA-dependent DNA polymerase)